MRRASASCVRGGLNTLGVSALRLSGDVGRTVARGAGKNRR